jgi:hypothetical protein
MGDQAQSQSESLRTKQALKGYLLYRRSALGWICRLDVFDKCRQCHAARERRAAGFYPYDLPLDGTEVDLIMGTFSKSFVSLGGVIAGDEDVILCVQHHGCSLIFSASMPASSVAAVLASLEIMETEADHLEHLVIVGRAHALRAAGNGLLDRRQRDAQHSHHDRSDEILVLGLEDMPGSQMIHQRGRIACRPTRPVSAVDELRDRSHRRADRPRREHPRRGGSGAETH